MLSDIFEKVEEGGWVHIFPEGKIEQREGEPWDSYRSLSNILT